MALNFSESSFSSSSLGIDSPHPPSAPPSIPRSLGAPTAPTPAATLVQPTDAAAEEAAANADALPTTAKTRGGTVSDAGPGRGMPTAAATVSGGADVCPPLAPAVSGRLPAKVTAVPLVWGERSDEVERFGAEVVVMSDVVYDPTGAVT